MGFIKLLDTKFIWYYDAHITYLKNFYVKYEIMKIKWIIMIKTDIYINVWIFVIQDAFTTKYHSMYIFFKLFMKILNGNVYF